MAPSRTPVPSRSSPPSTHDRVAVILLRLASALFVLVVVMPYLPFHFLDGAQTVCGSQVLRVGLLPVVVLNLLHWRAQRREAAVLAMVLAAGVLLLEIVFLVPFTAPSAEPGDSALTVQTHNTRGVLPDRMVHVLRTDPPDIVCLQELSVAGVNFIDHRADGLGITKAYTPGGDRNSMRVYLFSRLPVLGQDSVAIPLEKGETGWYPVLRVEHGGDSLTVVGVHLASVPRDPGLASFAEAQRLREAQLDRLLAYAETVNGPLLLLGDFNTTPTERMSRWMRDQFEDTWLRAGKGLGGTWPAGLPFLRIDYIYSRGMPEPAQVGPRDMGGSDHLAYRVQFRDE